MTTPNAALAYAVLDQIDAHPKAWNQGTWDCGTAACFAGWAVRLSGGINDGTAVVEGPSGLVGYSVEEAAHVVLGIDEDTAWTSGNRDWLFGPNNTREDLGRLVEEIFGPRPDGGEDSAGGVAS